MARVSTTLMKGLRKGRTGNLPTSRIDQHGRILARDTTRKPEANLQTIPHDQPRANSPINHCVDQLQEGLLARSQNSTQRPTMNTYVNSHVKVAHTVPRHLQRKEISPRSALCYYQKEYK